MHKPIAFDLDGTLFQAHLVGLPAYTAVFTRLKSAKLIEEMPRLEFSSFFGLTGPEIWRLALPHSSEDVRETAAKWMDEEERKQLECGAGELYPGVMETLDQLYRQGHPLLVVSNGTESYVKAVCRNFGLAPMLAGVYSAGEYRTETKGRLLKIAVEELGLEPGLMVGDRGKDMDAALANGFTAVACTYGYGSKEEFSRAHHVIDEVGQVLDLAGKEKL